VIPLCGEKNVPSRRGRILFGDMYGKPHDEYR
jgi:hypothetical protein